MRYEDIAALSCYASYMQIMSPLAFSFSLTELNISGLWRYLRTSATVWRNNWQLNQQWRWWFVVGYLPHVLKRTKSNHVVFQVSFNFLMHSEHKMHKHGWWCTVSFLSPTFLSPLSQRKKGTYLIPKIIFSFTCPLERKHRKENNSDQTDFFFSVDYCFFCSHVMISHV